MYVCKASTWKNKQGAIIAFATFIQHSSHVCYREILTVVKENTKGFRESNINLNKSLFDLFASIFSVLRSNEEVVDGWVCELIVPIIVEKIADRKLSSVSKEILFSICELKKPEGIILLTVNSVNSVKSPLVHEELLKWSESMCQEFGSSSLESGIQTLITWALKVSDMHFVIKCLNYANFSQRLLFLGM